MSMSLTAVQHGIFEALRPTNHEHVEMKELRKQFDDGELPPTYTV